jgi:AbrB family looped-hinge helix DNA binding protein
MQSVKISPKFQVVIPRHIRESMHLRAGQKIDTRLDREEDRV